MAWKDITSLTLNGYTACEKILKHIDRLSANLRTLDLALYDPELTYVSPLFEMTFPKLRSLSLDSFALEDTAQAMIFWSRHPSLEILNIYNFNEDMPWFSRDLLFSNFLPNLKHLRVHHLISRFEVSLTSLKAPFCDVRILSPILSQLVSLRVYNTINAQLPYLLRAVLPDGLPNLKSLNIGQRPSNSGKNVDVEGALWYETEDGKFREAKVTKAQRSVVNGYIPSIARGAPNLEEIGFHSWVLSLGEFVTPPPDLSKCVLIIP
jgi:hypothetical protein